MTDAGHIHVLPDHVINQIAAGEVVERPASVLKELLENALDAGATQIDVEVADGGRALVRVSDNGGGMTRDDALLAIERHATSKIQDAADIERIRTMGFRGEALAAIAAVSRFRLQTQPSAGAAGTEITMTGGKIQDVRETGGAPGTVIEVRNLFFNVPARRKFLRSAPTENDHVRRTFITAALARPDAGFSLIADRRRVYALPAQSELAERLRELFPALPFENLRPVRYRRPDLFITGYTGLPAAGRGDRGEQYLYVNGRPAGAPVLYSAIRAGYQGVLPPDRHPVLFLFLELDPGMVDVNVHPTKKEVRFRDSAAARNGVVAALTEALRAETAGMPPSDGRALFHGSEQDRPGVDLPAMDQFLRAMQSRHWPGASAAGAPPRPIALPLTAIGGVTPCPGKSAAPPDGGVPAAAGSVRGSTKDAAAGAPWPWYRLLGFVGNRYAVLETDDGLALLDPHAAHERVLYERFRREYQEQKLAVQPLLAAVTVELPPTDAARVRRYLALLQRIGFGIEEFGGNAFVIDAAPACLETGAPEAIIAEIAARLDEAGSPSGAAALADARRAPREEQAMRAACHAAVKASRPLDAMQLDALLEQLIRTAMPYTCPHGRPTLIHISLQELNRKFGRE